MGGVRRLSIVIPSHNEGTFLPCLLTSIFKLLSDDFQTQVIVVDNGSTDNTERVISSFGCEYEYVRLKVFPSKARNLGVNRVSNDVLVFLDADTEITEEWKAALIENWEQISKSGLFLTGAKCSIPENSSWLEKYWFANQGVGHEPNYINGCNMVTNLKTFQALSGLSEKLETGEDVDFSERIKRLGGTVRHNSNFKIIHHGYPKKLSMFIRREMWHSLGDVASIGHFFRSRVVLVSLIFLLFHFILFVGLVFSINYMGLAGLLGVVGVCVFSSIKTFNKAGLSSIAVGAGIYYFYFVGRILGSIKGIWLRSVLNREKDA